MAGSTRARRTRDRVAEGAASDVRVRPIGEPASAVLDLRARAYPVLVAATAALGAFAFMMDAATFWSRTPAFHAVAAPTVAAAVAGSLAVAAAGTLRRAVLPVIAAALFTASLAWRVTADVAWTGAPFWGALALVTAANVALGVLVITDPGAGGDGATDPLAAEWFPGR